jgi:glyoxylase-like metal-dependent hydrolase (beta-lactamase superfamily II)
MSPDTAAAGALDFPFAELPADGAVTEVADGILWLSTPLPFAGLRQVNLWLLSDGGGWTMVDCGYGNDKARATIEASWNAGLGGRPVTRLIVTHFHPDHAGNAAWIAERWGLRPMMTQAEWFAANLAVTDRLDEAVARRVAFFRENGLDEARIKLFAEGAVPYSAGVRLPRSFARIKHGDALSIGGEHWTVLTGEGHSPEHATLYNAARKILISGDQILPTITTNISVWPTEPEADPLALFLASGRRFAQLLAPRTLVLPSHRLPFRNVHLRLEQLRRHHDERLALILESVKGETAAADLIDVLFKRKLDGHQMGFAMGEALAHLNHLVNAGKLVRRRGADGVVRFAHS